MVFFQTSRAVFTGVLLSSLALSLTSCDDIKAAAKAAYAMETAKVWIEKVKFKVDQDVNGNSPLAVHLLIIYDKEVLEQISKLTAERYFETETQIRSDNPEKIQFITWEIVPGQSVDEQDIILKKAMGEGALIFARYHSIGDHRAALADDREIIINLHNVEFDVKKIK